MGWREFQFTASVDKEDNEDKVQLVAIPHDSLIPLYPRSQQSKSEQLSLGPSEFSEQLVRLDDWLERIRLCDKQEQVYQVVRKFKRLPCLHPSQFEKMYHAYKRRLHEIGVEQEAREQQCGDEIPF
jgi:hypothetical protein